MTKEAEIANMSDPKPATPDELQDARIRKLHAKNPGKIAYQLRPGFKDNPLLKIGRNTQCPCGSGKKYKHCHLESMPRHIPELMAKQYEKALAQASAENAVLRFEMDPGGPNVKTTSEGSV